jgi:nitroimidazol reductase NimA-like FMN-containing flavoprotein (pyridoxamine 5'-phosphate oxidase superfamily)
VKIRVNDNEVKSGKLEMEKILKRAEVGRLALSTGSMPYIIPLNFLYWDGKIAFHCRWKGKKMDLIAGNSACCFEVDEFMGEVSYHYDSLCHLDYDSVLALGKARTENNRDSKKEVFQRLHAKYKEIYRKPVSTGGVRFDEARLDEACCVIIDIEELTGRRERTVEDQREKKVWRYRFPKEL